MTISSVFYEWETLGHRYRLCRPGLQIDDWTELSPPDARWALRPVLGAAHTTRA